MVNLNRHRVVSLTDYYTPNAYNHTGFHCFHTSINGSDDEVIIPGNVYNDSGVKCATGIGVDL